MILAHLSSMAFCFSLTNFLEIFKTICFWPILNEGQYINIKHFAKIFYIWFNCRFKVLSFLGPEFSEFFEKSDPEQDLF
jgi:hypothetical protein